MKLRLYANAYIYIECVGQSMLGIGIYTIHYFIWPEVDYVCVRPRDIENRLPNVVLENFGRPLPLLLV